MSAQQRIGSVVISLVVALGAAIAAIAGILLRGGDAFVTVTSPRGETYDMATSGVYAYNAQRVVAEGVGWDVVTLVVLLPAMLLSLPFLARGSTRGRLFALGLLGYFFYQYLEYSVTWAFGPLFLLWVALFAASLVGIGWIAYSLVIARDTVSESGERFPRLGWATLNLAMSGLLVLLWLQRIALVTRGEPGILLGETTLTIQALDLGLVVPVSVATALLLLWRHSLGYPMAAAFGVTYAAMSIAITGMLLSAWLVEGALEIVPIAIFTVASVASIWLLILTFRESPLALRPQRVSSPIGATSRL
jgi:hypothetical protein